MRPRTFLTVSALLILPTGMAQADDHLFQAQQRGLRSGSQASTVSHAFTTNRAGHSGDLAPGQGSPFTGRDRQTPATDTEAANVHANVKERTK
jgi:hypothetical protein